MLRKLKLLLQWWNGDHAYRQYLQHHAQLHAGEQPLSRKAFHAAETSRKWSGINRCC